MEGRLKKTKKKDQRITFGRELFIGAKQRRKKKLQKIVGITHQY